MDICLLWVLCVLSGRVLCDELITRPEESCRLWPVVVCDLETSWMRRPWPAEGCSAKNNQTNTEYWFLAFVDWKTSQQLAYGCHWSLMCHMVAVTGDWICHQALRAQSLYCHTAVRLGLFFCQFHVRRSGDSLGYGLCYGNTRWLSWLRHCATSHNVKGSIPDGVI